MTFLKVNVTTAERFMMLNKMRVEIILFLQYFIEENTRQLK